MNNNNYIFKTNLIINENANSMIYIKNYEIFSSFSTEFKIKFWDLKTLENILITSNIKCWPYPNSISLLLNEYIDVGSWDNNAFI